jgi:hypothetical protein
VFLCAECPALGKQALYRAQDFVECGSRQSPICRVPDKKHSVKPPALDNGPDSGSGGLRRRLTTTSGPVGLTTIQAGVRSN